MMWAILANGERYDPEAWPWRAAWRRPCYPRRSSARSSLLSVGCHGV